jgi:hypothetical protein
MSVGQGRGKGGGMDALKSRRCREGYEQCFGSLESGGVSDDGHGYDG